MSQAASAVRNFLDSFVELRRLPRAFWYSIGAFVVDSMAYFGMLTLMTVYLSTDLAWSDFRAGITVSIFTMLVTLFMLGVGSVAEGFGLRRAILFALVLTVTGRLLYTLGPWLGHRFVLTGVVLVSLLIVAIGEAILQPVCYSGVKQYTDEKTHSMGYGLIYALMNLGIVGIGAISAWLRPAVEAMKHGTAPDVGFGAPVVKFFAGFSPSGVEAVNWACVFITILALVLTLALLTRKAEAAKLRPDTAEQSRTAVSEPLGKQLKEFFGGGPFSNPRFIFFIFMLLPVRTLFAHQWLTMPQYILRAYDQSVGDRMEWLVNWINPLIIFIAVPITTALTRQVNVYTMMVLGAFVSAAPTFLLCAGPNLGLLITYFIVFSIGEALWSARFLEYASELAPPGRIAQYMGLALVPWLLAKVTTGLYSGLMLSNYVGKAIPRSEMHSGTMWFIYGCIAMTSPIGLWLARKWVRAGLQAKRLQAAT